MVLALGSRVGWTPARKEQTNEHTVYVKPLHPSLNVLVVISNGIWAVELGSNSILHFLTGGAS